MAESIKPPADASAVVLDLHRWLCESIEHAVKLSDKTAAQALREARDELLRLARLHTAPCCKCGRASENRFSYDTGDCYTSYPLCRDCTGVMAGKVDQRMELWRKDRGQK